MPRGRHLDDWKRAFLAVWHAARGILVRSQSSKVFHLAKAAYHGYRLLEKQTKDAHEKYGVSKKQYGLLLLLATGESFTVKDAAERLKASQGTVRKYLNLFVKAGIADKDTSTRPYLYRMKDKYLKAIRKSLKEND